METVIARYLNSRALHVVLAAIVITLIAPSQLLAANSSSCPTEPAQAIAAAREALGSQDALAERAALLCLIEAKAALDAKVEGIRTGTIPLEGAINAQGGLLLKHYSKAD